MNIYLIIGTLPKGAVYTKAFKSFLEAHAYFQLYKEEIPADADIFVSEMEENFLSAGTLVS
jgi:hypothetical protein